MRHQSSQGGQPGTVPRLQADGHRSAGGGGVQGAALTHAHGEELAFSTLDKIRAPAGLRGDAEPMRGDPPHSLLTLPLLPAGCQRRDATGQGKTQDPSTRTGWINGLGSIVRVSTRRSVGSCTWVTTPCSATGLGRSSWKAAQWKRTWGCWSTAS